MKSVVYDGRYEFQVGPDSHDIVASSVTVYGSLTPTMQYVTVQPEAVAYQAGDTIDLTGKNQWIKDDTNPALEQRNLAVTADNVVEAVNNDQSFVDLSTAHVKYASSNPSVASVTSTGLVRAVKNGVATITVTVNGVSGSAPVVVQGTLTNTVPAIMDAGSSNASATFTNGDANAVKNVALAISVPAGWSATPSTPTTFASVPGGSAVTATWAISPGADVSPGTYQVSFTASSSEGTFSSSGQVKVPYASVAAAYDNTGISNDNAPAAGAFDGGGLNYSAQALAADGFVSGQNVTVGVGWISYSWPSANVPDNIVAGGQVVPLSGTGNLLGFLGASNNGTTSGAGTIVYTDGTTQAYTLSFADWWSRSAAAGTSIAATTNYINNGANSSRQNQTVHVYEALVPLNAAKTVRYVILPDVTENGQVTGTPAMHLFALGVGTEAPNIALGKPATASSESNAQTPAAAAFDGNMSTRWGAHQPADSWLQVDLGDTYDVFKVVIEWEASYAKGYKLQTSSDGVTWTDAFTETAGDGGSDVVNLDVNTRYIRMQGTEKSGQWGYSIYEMKVYGQLV